MVTGEEDNYGSHLLLVQKESATQDTHRLIIVTFLVVAGRWTFTGRLGYSLADSSPYAHPNSHILLTGISGQKFDSPPEEVYFVLFFFLFHSLVFSFALVLLFKLMGGFFAGAAGALAALSPTGAPGFRLFRSCMRRDMRLVLAFCLRSMCFLFSIVSFFSFMTVLVLEAPVPFRCRTPIRFFIAALATACMCRKGWFSTQVQDVCRKGYLLGCLLFRLFGFEILGHCHSPNLGEFKDGGDWIRLSVILSEVRAHVFESFFSLVHFSVQFVVLFLCVIIKLL